MSAPAAIVVSKLFCPESTVIDYKKSWDEVKNLPKSSATNVFEVISEGSTSIAKCISAIICNLIGFVSIFYFLDALIRWLFILVGVNNAGSKVFLLNPFVLTYN
jgi:nucleoside permease NupC